MKISLLTTLFSLLTVAYGHNVRGAEKNQDQKRELEVIASQTVNGATVTIVVDNPPAGPASSGSEMVVVPKIDEEEAPGASGQQPGETPGSSGQPPLTVTGPAQGGQNPQQPINPYAPPPFELGPPPKDANGNDICRASPWNQGWGNRYLRGLKVFKTGCENNKGCGGSECCVVTRCLCVSRANIEGPDAQTTDRCMNN